MGTPKPVDPITVQVIRNALISAANEMTDTLIRTSCNPTLYALVDFCADLFDENADLMAEGRGAVVFMGTVSFGIKNVVNHIGKENIDEGDVIVSTYSYFIGNHPSDVLVFKPIFYNGSIFGYAAVKAHLKDIGAAQPYGHHLNTEYFHDGLILPGTKIVKKGVLDREILDIIRFHSRLPDSTTGDLTAQMTACRAGESRVLGLIGKYGEKTVRQAIRAYMDQDEIIMRTAIAGLPEGEYHAECEADDNGQDDNPVKVSVTLQIKGGEITFDTTGSASQQVSAFNTPLPTTVALCRLATKTILDPMTRSSEGHWRPLKVVSPAGSLFNPQPPHSTAQYIFPGQCLAECVVRALSQAVPEKAVAGSGGDISPGLGVFGVDPRDGRWFQGNPGQNPVGQGASPYGDGGDAIIHFIMSGMEAVPVEVSEERFPVLIEKWSLRQDSGGAGKFRGGLGTERYVRTLADGRCGGTIERTKYAPWGLNGGKNGLTNIGLLWPGTDRQRKFGKIAKVALNNGDRYCILTGGGGGWGDPFERDVQTVLDDVVKGFVSLECARKDYGVAIKEQGGEYTADEGETRRLRQKDTGSHSS